MKITSLEVAIPIKTCQLTISPQGRSGNQLLQYLFAIVILDSVKNVSAKLSNIEIQNFNIFHKDETSVCKRVFKISSPPVSVVSVIDAVESGRYDLVIIDFLPLKIELLPKVARCREVLSAYLAEPIHLNLMHDQILVHVRSGDILTGSHPDYTPLPLKAYKRFFDQTKLRPVFIGELESSWYLDCLKQMFPGAVFLESNGLLLDFLKLGGAPRVLLSISTFAWLSSWISTCAKEVYIPLLGMMNPIQRTDINLIPWGDTRYKLIVFGVFALNVTAENRKRILFEDFSIVIVNPNLWLKFLFRLICHPLLRLPIKMTAKYALKRRP